MNLVGMPSMALARYGNLPRARMLIAPPHGLLRGKRARSSTRTRAPPIARVRAAVAPAGPPPTITTSERSTRPLLSWQPAATDEIGEKLVRPVGARGDLPPETEAHEDPMALSHRR